MNVSIHSRDKEKERKFPTQILRDVRIQQNNQFFNQRMITWAEAL